MGDRETTGMCENGESKTTQIMMATVPHVTSGSGLGKFLADGFLLDSMLKHPAFFPQILYIFGKNAERHNILNRMKQALSAFNLFSMSS